MREFTTVTVSKTLLHLIKKYSTALLMCILLALSVTSLIYLTATALDTDTETVFTIAHVPDTQNEVMTDGTPLLTARYQWLLDNKDALNLKFIAHTGDVVNWGVADPVQFTRADTATSVLDNGAIPFSYAIGNHDTAAVTVGGSAAAGNTRTNLRNTVLFNQTFPVTRFKDVAGAFEAGKVDNMYQTFHAGGTDWLVLTHEMWPRQVVIDWMKQVVEAHPTHNVIISTHAFIDGTGSFPTTGFYGDTTAQSEWDQFVSQYANIKMVLSGHYGPSDTTSGVYYSTRIGAHGNKVAQIMTAYHSNYQNQVRLLKIDTANQTLSSTVYASASTSSYPTGYITDTYSNFSETNMNWLGGNGGETLQTVPGAPYGVTATPGVGSATVTFSPPLSDGNSPITNYTVTSSPGAIIATGTGSPITVTGLTNGTSYTFTVTATNAIGTSIASVASSTITPTSDTPELLADPGFELGNGGWKSFVVGTLTRVQTPVRNGMYAMQVAAVSSTTATVGMTQNSVVSNSVSGKKYTAQCYVRPSISGRTIQMRLLEYTQNYSSYVNIGQVIVTNIPAGSWTQVLVSGISTTSGRRVIPQIYSTNQTTTTGTVTYDDCSVVAEAPVNAPSAPAITNVSASAGSASVSFTPPASNGGAAVTSYTVTSNPGGITATGSGSPITVNGLTNGVSYTFTVTATNSAGTGVASVASNAVVPMTFPGTPANLVVSTHSDSIALNWVAPADNGGTAITDYEIWYRPVGSETWNMVDDGVSATTNATATGLDVYARYEFFVDAVNAVGSGGASAIVASTPYVETAAPGVPTNVSATAGAGVATVSFDAPVSDGNSPVLFYTVTSVPGGITASGTASPVTISGLTNGVAYAFIVTATNAAGTSDASLQSNAVTPFAVPGAPTNVTATAGNASAVVSFTVPTDNGGIAITSYVVTSSPGGITKTGSSSPITVTGLTNGVSYTFTVAAVNDIGQSVASSPSNAVSPRSADLLPDPDFELGTVGGWVAFNVGTLSVVGTPVYSGNKALSISTTTTTSQLVGMTQNSAVTNSTAGKTYTFSCYVRPSVSGRNMVIRLLEYTQNYSSNVKIGTVIVNNIASNAWTQLKVTGASTTSGRRIIPQVYATNQTASSGVVYYDNCSFTVN